MIPGGHAEELGVVPGMLLSKIGGKMLSDLPTHSEVVFFFREAVSQMV